MKTATFSEGLLVALVLSIFGALSFYFFNYIIPTNSGLYLTVSLLSFFYLIYLIARSEIKTGRIIAFSLWAVITISSWLLLLPFSIFLLVQISIIWILRSLYFYSSLLSSLTDLILTGLSISAAIWAGLHTGTLFLALWSFFLMQSLFVLIPKSLKPLNIDNGAAELDNDSNDAFNRAYQTAKHALGKLSN